MSKAMTLLDTVTDTSQIIDMVNSLGVEMPHIQGLKDKDGKTVKKNYFFNPKEQNALLLNYANKLLIYYFNIILYFFKKTMSVFPSKI